MNEPSFTLPAYDLNWAFFLDIDGTLVDQAPTPDTVHVDGALHPMLEELRAATGGAVALVSGRALMDMDALFPLKRLAAAGQHGIERRDAQGVVHVRAFGEAPLRQAARQLLRFVARRQGLMLEDKGYTLALHYRMAPQYEAEVRRAAEATLSTLGTGFELQRGKMVYEIKPGGTDKGTAVEAFMSEAPFSGRIPVFLGDDRTDEFGFEVVNRLGGYTIKVGEGESVARWRLPNPATARAWLAGWLETVPAAGGVMTDAAVAEVLDSPGQGGSGAP